MNSENNTTFNNIVNSVGGPDMFIWIIMFGLLIIFVAVMAYLNKDYSE